MAGVASAIDGVVVTSLDPKYDHRGVFTEVFRAEWPTGLAPVQWNFVASDANVLRGFHVHVTHADYLVCVHGELVLGLKDIRPDSPTHNRTELLTLRPEAAAGVMTPPGVAHGFYFPKPSMHLYCVSHYWNMADELGCRWDDPDIGLAWPTASPTLSKRDTEAGSFGEMVSRFLSGQARERT
jgi:dTDP-4-dehydrorhamnose 3,5-epimerase